MGEVGNDADGPWTSLIQIEADGAGNADWQTLPLPNESGRFAYTLAADNTLFLTDVARGAISPDGDCFVAVETNPDRQSLHFGLRTSSGISAAGLSGQYIKTQINVREFPATVSRTLVEFESNNLRIYDLDGDELDHFVFILSDNGALHVSKDDVPYSQVGIVGLDGDVFIWMDGKSMNVGIRTSSQANNAMLSGTFLIGQISSGTNIFENPPVSGVWSARYHGRFDGLTTFSVLERRESDDAAVVLWGDYEYSVLADGALYLDPYNFGFVSSKGNLFVAIEDPDAFDLRFFYVGIKRGP